MSLRFLSKFHNAFWSPRMPQPVPAQYSCLIPNVIREFCKLERRTNELVTHRKRLINLAQPKRITPKYSKCCIYPHNTSAKVELIKAESPIHTRTEQLSLPLVRHLLNLQKMQSYEEFSQCRKLRVIRLMRQSLCSMYSRLGNVGVPVKPLPPAKLTQQELENQIRRLSMPQKSKKIQSPQERKAGGGNRFKSTKATATARSGRYGMAGGKGNSQRYKKLARPRLRSDIQPKEWKLTDALKNYVPSDRIVELAASKSYIPPDYDKPFRVSLSALNYKASERIHELAKPTKKLIKCEYRRSPGSISRKALEAEPSKRVKELAIPKKWNDHQTRLHPYRTSRKALRARASERVRELAQPKIIMT